jgi:hypothetical protein
LRKGEKPVLPGEEREEEAKSNDGCRWSPQAERESAFLFQVPLKPTLPDGKAGPGGSHPIMNEWGRLWGVPSQVRVVWPIPRQLHEPQTFPTSSLTHIHGVNSVLLYTLLPP